MRILVVSPYPPRRDGIAAYAVQQVQRLRADGHHVEVCSPYPSAAHHHLDLAGPRAAAALARLARRFDRVIVHFHPDLFYPDPATPGFRLAEGLALGAAWRAAPDLEVRLHEVDDRWGRGSGPAAAATRWLWRAPERIAVHTVAQRNLLLDGFGLDPARLEVVAHGADFVPRATGDRAAARAALAQPADGFAFLCIGFLQPHKGFDRAVRAFAAGRLAERGARLDVVGSVRVDDPDALDHADELRRVVASSRGVELHEGYVSDEVFDRWLVAADAVVLPYRHIWSSSVVERAALYGKPVIGTRVEGLADQLATIPGAVIVDDDAGLAAAMAAALAGEPAEPASATSVRWAGITEVDLERVQAEIRERAAVARGGPLVAKAAGGAQRAVGGRAAVPSAPLRRLRPLSPPKAVSARPGVSGLKRLIRRLIAWELDPVVTHVNRLHQATTEAIELQAVADADDSPPPTHPGNS